MIKLLAWVRKDEGHNSLNMDMEADQRWYIADLIKRRNFANDRI